MNITCQESPYLSCVHPYFSLNGYWPSFMSVVLFFESCFHNESTSSFVLQATRNDTDGLNLKSGFALISVNSCPKSSMVTRSTEPEGVLRRVVVFFILESFFENVDV